MKKTVLGYMVILAAACTSVSERTTIKGEFSGADAPSEVTISVSDIIDTTVTLKNSSFKINVPVAKSDLGVIKAGTANTAFISDGTVLTVSMEDGELTVKSGKAAKSLTERLNAFMEKSSEFGKEFRTGMKAIADSTGLTAEQKNALQEAYYDEFDKKYIAYNKEVISANTDNVISAYALRNIYSDLEDDSLEVVCGSIDSTVLARNSFIGKILDGVTARKRTAEGMKFTDFSIPQPDGTVASLSDYVGKGKYVLVDFWASWCGPCKRAIPHVKSVYDKYRGKDFDVLSVAVWEKSAQESIDTAKVYKVNWNQIVDAQSIPTDIYGILGIPHIVLFGPDGTILKRGLYGDEIEKEVAKYVGKH